MTSFGGTTFKELASDSAYGGWTKAATAVLKHIPGGSTNVIQKIGSDRPRITLTVLVTASQLTTLYGQVGDETNLIFSYESCDATLEKIDGALSIGIDNDLYTANLSFIRTGQPGNIPTLVLLMESGSALLLEDSSAIHLE